MSRANYSKIKAQYNALGKGGVRLTQSTLILTKAISSTQTNYAFDVLDSQTTTLQANEIRLNQNDEFVVTHIGVYLQGIANTGATKLMSYAPFELDATKSGTLNGLFDGYLKISVNNIVFIDKWDTRKHEFVPVKQHEAFVAATAALTSHEAAIAAFSSREFTYPVEPMITLSGAKKNAVELLLPVALTGQTFTLASNTGTYSVVIDRIAIVLRGWNAQNGAAFQK